MIKRWFGFFRDLKFVSIWKDSKRFKKISSFYCRVYPWEQCLLNETESRVFYVATQLLILLLFFVIYSQFVCKYSSGKEKYKNKMKLKADEEDSIENVCLLFSSTQLWYSFDQLSVGMSSTLKLFRVFFLIYDTLMELQVVIFMTLGASS